MCAVSVGCIQSQSLTIRIYLLEDRIAPALDQSFRRAVLIVTLANLSYFFVEVAVALHIGSVSLFADSIDFLEDASVNFLILIAIGWSAVGRGRVGRALACILFVPALATLWMAWRKFNAPLPPEPLFLSIAGVGALVVNVACAFLLVRHRHIAGSLSKAAFLSARNDATANFGIIAAALATIFVPSGWPDLAVGLGIAVMNVDAARAVWSAASQELDAAKP